MQDGDKVFVVCDAHIRIPNATHPQSHLRNTGRTAFESGKLTSRDTFFAGPPGGLAKRGFAVQSRAG